MSVTRFVRAVAKHVQNGARVVNEDILMVRMTECNKCQHRLGARCKLCGCFVKVKTRWAEQSCPENRWQAEV